jgi:LPS-assembly protein
VDKFRGSIESAGAFNINKFWVFGWDGKLDSDNTFRRFYKIDSIYATDEISKLYLIGQGDKSYMSIQAIHFGNLASTLPGYRAVNTTTSDSNALPLIDYSYVFDRPVIAGELSFNANAVSLTSQSSSISAPDTRRVASDVRWRKTVTDPAGQIFTPFLYARGDIYDVAGYTDPLSGNETNGSLARGTAAAGLEYRYPFVKQMEAAAVIDPSPNRRGPIPW